MNGPNGPLRSTITRPQASQYSSSFSSGFSSCGLAAKFSLVKVQLSLSFLL